MRGSCIIPEAGLASPLPGRSIGGIFLRAATGRLQMNLATKLAYIAWALPNTLLGTVFGSVGLLTGARLQVRRGVLEFYGGGVRWMLQRGTPGGFASAITFGHTILARDEASLDFCREHEHVHVRQYERWGPLFLPAYLLCSLVLWLRGRDAYRENPFEREAYEEARNV